MKRMEWLDAMKGIGILLIMSSHLFSTPILGKYLYVGFIPLFFFISGVTARRTCDPFSTFAISKAKRLLIPYFFYSILFTSIIVVLSGNYLYFIGVLYSRYCLYSLGTDPNFIFMSTGATTPLWLLTCLFFSQGLFYFYTHRKTKTQKVVSIIAFALVGYALSFLPILLPWSIDTSFLLTLFTIIGYELYQRFNHLSNKINYYIVPLLVSIPLLVALSGFNGVSNISVSIFGSFRYISYWIYIMCSVFYIIIIYTVSIIIQGSVISKLLAFIGRMSLELMCIHLFIFTMISMLVQQVGGNMHVVDYFILPVIVVICSIYSKAKNKYLNNTKFMKYI